MGLLSIFSPSTDNAAAPQTASEVVEVARSKARRRLIGAAVLLGIGVIAFPLIFETQPRPIHVDIPIVVPSRDGAPPLAMPTTPSTTTTTTAATKPAAARAASDAAPAPKLANKLPDIVEKAEPDKVPAAKPAEKKTAVKPADKPADKPVEKVADKPVVAVPAVSAAASSPAAERFVIQVGAFAEDDAVREARSKIEKLGLRTYIQAVDTKEGKRTRVRLGPYASREEADKAAAKLKAAGLVAAVLML
jgi:DedD protein